MVELPNQSQPNVVADLMGHPVHITRKDNNSWANFFLQENEAKASRYKEDETINGINASSKVNNEKTQVTNIL